MNIIPKAPSPVVLPPSNATSNPESPRQRAINAFKESAANLNAVNQAQAEAVRNPSQVSVEELSAVKSSSSQGKSDTSEAAPESGPKEATTVKEEPLSTQYAILARKEKALRAKAQAQEAAHRQREAAFLAKEEALKLQNEQRGVEYQSNYISKDRITKDPLAVLSELGLSNEQITQLALSAPSQQDIQYKTEIDSLKAEVRSLRDEANGVKKTFEERDNQSYQQAVGQIRRDAQRLIQSDPSYEAIKQTGQVEEVVKLIEKTFKEDGDILDVADAAKLVEDELVERFYRYSNSISKVKSRFAAKPSEPAPKATAATQGKSQMKTLTNSVSSSRPLSAKERAILAFNNQLKN